MKYTEKDLSLVIPSRNNLKYVKWGYDAIRSVSKDITICYADDASSDGMWEWIIEVQKTDSKVKAIRNDGPLREGHTILYDKIINELVETPLAMIYHADMFCFKNTFKNCLKHMKPRVIVSSTRVEPPLHPPGPEKHIFDMGEEPEMFKEKQVEIYVNDLEKMHTDEITHGIFAPWMFFKEDFVKIGGHDEGFYPQSKEDSDIFNRFVLDGVSVIQSRDSFVAHLTCRGSRRNPNLTNVHQDSKEWLEHNFRSTRNFIRKWGHMVKHDSLMNPVIPHKYDVGFDLTIDVDLSDGISVLGSLEPWCSNVLVDNEFVRVNYIKTEQLNTKFNLQERVLFDSKLDNEVVVSLKASDLIKTQRESFYFIQNFADILSDSGDVGEMSYGIFNILIKSLGHHENKLIKCENIGWRRTNHK